jgi:hypothetical protein
MPYQPSQRIIRLIGYQGRRPEANRSADYVAQWWRNRLNVGGLTDFASQQNVEGVPVLVDRQVSITGSQLIGVSDAGEGFVTILAIERRIRFEKLLQFVPLSGVDAAVTGFDTHVAFLRQTYPSVDQRDYIKRLVFLTGVAAATNHESKPSHIPFTVCLPDLLGLNVQSRQPAAPVTVVPRDSQEVGSDNSGP